MRVFMGCGGQASDPAPSPSGGGENVDDMGPSGGGSGSGGIGSVDEVGHDVPGRELCLIDHNGCQDGVVHAMIGWFCSPIAVTCEAGCSATPRPIDAEVDGWVDYATARDLITEALCAPESDGVAGAAGSGSSSD